MTLKHVLQDQAPYYLLALSAKTEESLTGKDQGYDRSIGKQGIRSKIYLRLVTPCWKAGIILIIAVR